MSKHKPKLTEAQKEQIRAYLADGRIKQTWIAQQFNVNQSLVAYYNRRMKYDRV